jgi:hypothetical protein
MDSLGVEEFILLKKESRSVKAIKNLPQESFHWAPFFTDTPTNSPFQAGATTAFPIAIFGSKIPPPSTTTAISF